MIHLLDSVIKTTLLTGWTPPTATPVISFTTPDETWQTTVRGEEGLHLNIYLYEVRENRDFRRTQWDLNHGPDGIIWRTHPPVYFDCHYLISAWHPGKESEAVQPTLEEHEGLAEALRVLLRKPEVIPGEFGVGGTGSAFKNAHVSLSLAPPEAPRLLNDFWNSMKLPWRPAIQLIATAPLDLNEMVEGGEPVTSLVINVGPTEVEEMGRLKRIDPETADQLVTLGGSVYNAKGEPIADAWVRVAQTGQTVKTDDMGQFLLDQLDLSQQYTLITRATGYQEGQRMVAVPEANYDIKLSAL